MSKEMRDVLDFTVRGPIPILLEDERSDHRSGCSVLDISFPEPVTIGEILFKNYYTAYVSVSCKRISIDQDPKNRDILPWEHCIRRMVLMSDPHCEQGSQEIFSVPLKESQLPWVGIVSVRLILRQPSSQWRKFGIEDLRIYKEAPLDRKLKVAVPEIFLSDKNEPEQLNQDGQVDNQYVDTVSHLQNIWAITELAKARQAGDTVGRFEVGGSYDISHLTYN